MTVVATNPAQKDTSTPFTLSAAWVLSTVYPADHFPRHVHAFVGDGEVIIVLGNEQVALAKRDDAGRGRATASDARKALRLADAHFAELLALWESMHD